MHILDEVAKICDCDTWTAHLAIEAVQHAERNYRTVGEAMNAMRSAATAALGIDCTDAYFTAHRIIDGEQHTLAVVDGQPVWRKGDV